ncbi:MAG TPA: cation:dicarboxylase symporter family transporter [Thermoanaerobaculia bacterium]|jgi:Na+/H+-dicarboxylate symporter|nr:cation:dicarboxylase symporter family transporter [Thermoanaerobaculia bacterium]
MKDGTRVLLALVAALILGALIALSGNASLLRAADAVAPIGTLWVNAIRMTVIPLVVALLVTGVAAAADLRAIGRIGGRTLLVFFLLLLGTAAVVVPLAPLLFAPLPLAPGARPALPPGAAEAAGQLAAGGEAPGFASWLTSLLPTNPIAAAANGAMLPLILFTLLLALAIARSPAAARETLLGFFRALGEAMLVLVSWIIKLAPVGIFALVLPLAAHGALGLAGAVGYYVLVYSLACLAVILLLYPVAAIGGGIPLRRFARAVLPAQLIAFSSSSSIASLPALIDTAERNLDMPPRIRGFVLPLATSTFKIAAPVSWTIGALFVARFYGIELHAKELVTIAFAAVFLAFAVPGVPRGAFLMLTPLFNAIGLPAEGIGILIAVDAIPDLFATVLNVTGDLTAAVLVARGGEQAPARADLEQPERAAVVP